VGKSAVLIAYNVSDYEKFCERSEQNLAEALQWLNPIIRVQRPER